MISNADAAQIIREVRSIEWYEDQISALRKQIDAIEYSLDYRPETFKDPLDMSRIVLDGEDARYKAPGSKYPSFSKSVEYDSLDEFNEKLAHYTKRLNWAMKYRDILLDGDGADFMNDFFLGMPYEGLKRKYHVSKPSRHAKAIIRKKINRI